MRKVELAIIGAGPAGISAAVTAAAYGVETCLIDEYVRPGGQLIKQTHKFFGSEAHRAGTRGIEIAKQYCDELHRSDVELMMGASVWGIFDSRILSVCHDNMTEQIRAEKIIIATGASENALAFPGWTLPGVMTAGAAQTSMNVNRVLPGKRVLMIGAGNVGCIIAYQLLQAGAEKVTIVEAKPEIGAYAVHSAKISRLGVPILTSRTVKEALGGPYVEKAVLVKLDGNYAEMPGTEETIDVDMICIACGLSPLTELARIASCDFVWEPLLGGYVPKVDAKLESSIAGIYVAGDCGGVEEASSAIEEGNIAALSVAESLGHLFPGSAATLRNRAYQRLNELRGGPFGKGRADAKNVIHCKADQHE